MNQDISFCHRAVSASPCCGIPPSILIVMGRVRMYIHDEMGVAVEEADDMNWRVGSSSCWNCTAIALGIIPVHIERAITRVNRAAKDHQFCRGKKMTAAQQRKRYDTIWFNPSSSSESDQICCNIVRLVYTAAADSLMFCVHSQTLFILQVIQYISTVDQSTSKTIKCEHNGRKRLTGMCTLGHHNLDCAELSFQHSSSRHQNKIYSILLSAALWFPCNFISLAPLYYQNHFPMGEYSLPDCLRL